MATNEVDKSAEIYVKVAGALMVCSCWRTAPSPWPA